MQALEAKRLYVHSILDRCATYVLEVNIDVETIQVYADSADEA